MFLLLKLKGEFEKPPASELKRSLSLLDMRGTTPVALVLVLVP